MPNRRRNRLTQTDKNHSRHQMMIFLSFWSFAFHSSHSDITCTVGLQALCLFVCLLSVYKTLLTSSSQAFWRILELLKFWIAAIILHLDYEFVTSWFLWALAIASNFELNYWGREMKHRYAQNTWHHHHHHHLLKLLEALNEVFHLKLFSRLFSWGLFKAFFKAFSCWVMPGPEAVSTA